MSDAPDWVESALHAHPTLTAEGIARRDAMRSTLQAAVVGRRNRRYALRAVTAAAALVLALLLVWPDTTQSGDGTGLDLDYIVLETVHDDPAAIARFEIDDDELLALCREAGRPTGLIRVGDELIFTEEVVDEEPAPR